MSKSDAFHYLDQARKCGAMSVKFNWRGESTLHKDLGECIKYAHDLGYVDIMLNTNGTLIGLYELISYQINGLTKLIISVDSFNPDTYCKIHGCTVKDYNTMITNLNYLCDMYNAKGLKYKVILNYHVNTLNEKETEQAIFHLYYDKYSMFKLNKKYTMNREGQDISIKQKKRKRKSYCPHMKRRLTVASNGKIFPCCVAYNEPSDLFCLYHMGIAIGYKEILIKNYKNIESCKNCTSADIWK
jgi:MoaA/NifB/PqqE/SkfB family radical SAM enzyme